MSNMEPFSDVEAGAGGNRRARSRQAMIRAVAGALAAASLGGCALEQSPEEQVRERAQERLELLMAGEFEKSMRYTTPAYRGSRGLDYYRRAFLGAPSWRGVEGVEAICEDEACDVRFELTYQTLQEGMVNTRTMKERWISLDGQWFIYLK